MVRVLEEKGNQVRCLPRTYVGLGGAPGQEAQSLKKGEVWGGRNNSRTPHRSITGKGAAQVEIWREGDDSRAAMPRSAATHADYYHSSRGVA